MAILFNEATLRTASKEVLEGPTTLATLNQNESNAQDGKADALRKDDANKVFYDNYKNIIIQYHAELQNLNGTVSTAYDENELIIAAKGQLGAQHFPTSPPWANFNPKLIDMVVGNPTSSTTSNELQALTNINAAISALTSGFSDGGVSDTLNTAWSGGTIEVVTGGFSAGQRAVVGLDTLVHIDAVAAALPSGQTLTVTVLAGTPSAASGAPIATSRAGFSNTERSTGTTTSPSIMAYFEGLLDAAVSVWNTALGVQDTVLMLNDAEGIERTEILTAIGKVAVAQSSISTWSSSSPKYSDTNLGSLETEMTLRSGTEVPARVTEILSALGFVSQDSSGAFSGTGNYFQLFKWINLRISRAGGTLTKYYSYDLVVNFSGNITDNKQNQLDEYAANLVVEGFSDSADGTDVVNLTDATPFSVSDTVYIVDDTSLPMFSGHIVAINSNAVQLNAPVTGFSSDSAARMVKVL